MATCHNAPKRSQSVLGQGGRGTSAIIAAFMVSAAGLQGARAASDEPNLVLHLQAWSKTPLRDLAGPPATEALLGAQLHPDASDPRPARLLGRAAWGFQGGRNSQLFLGLGAEHELDIAGAVTVAVVLQVDEPPSGKTAVVSKWQLINLGRSFELGIGRDLYPHFHISSSGMWDAEAAEIVGDRPIKAGEPYLLAGVFEPGRRLDVYVNGVRSNEEPPARPIPKKMYVSPTPVLVGVRPGSRPGSGLTGRVSEVLIYNRALAQGEIERLARRAGITSEVPPVPPAPEPPYRLEAIRDATRAWYRKLQAPEAPYGAYRLKPTSKPDLYASADIAWIRWMMDDLNALTPEQRRAWIDVIQDQQRPDGSYVHITGHCPTHAFCHATGALNMLGGKQRYRPKLLDPYLDVADMPRWLDSIDWTKPWGASHDIWGAGVPLACTPSTPQAWREALFAWLDKEVDPKTGMWRRGVPVESGLELLGGAFHIWPIYAAMGRELPHADEVIDFVLALQRADGSFDGGFGYGNMDGAWVLAYLMERRSHRRDEVREALRRCMAGLMKAYVRRHQHWLSDAHGTESRIATIAIISEVLPELFEGRAWRNPWHRRELFVIKVAKKE